VRTPPALLHNQAGSKDVPSYLIVVRTPPALLHNQAGSKDVPSYLSDHLLLGSSVVACLQVRGRVRQVALACLQVQGVLLLPGTESAYVLWLPLCVAAYGP